VRKGDRGAAGTLCGILERLITDGSCGFLYAFISADRLDVDPAGKEGDSSFFAEIPTKFFILVRFLAAEHVIDMQSDDLFSSEKGTQGVKERNGVRSARKADECFFIFTVEILLLVQENDLFKQNLGIILLHDPDPV
jgi:hypothetical protein